MRSSWFVHLTALAIGAAAAPSAARIVALEVAALHDPAARADLRLRDVLTSERVRDEIDAALRADDLELAQSFADLAAERGLPIDPGQERRLDELRAENPLRRAARDFGHGFAGGDAGSGAAITGALTADISGYGDLRDLAREGGKWLEGQPADPLVVGLSAAGLAITGATIVSLGAALPARGGITLVKAAQKTGRLSKPLALGLGRVAESALDREALQSGLAAARRLDLAAARAASARLIRPAALAEFRQVGGDVATVYRRAGARSAQDALAVAADRGELRQAARLASTKGTKTRAILRVLGRGVLLAGSLSLTLAGWLVSFVLYFLAAAGFARRMGAGIGRIGWKIFDEFRALRRATEQGASSAVTKA